MEGIDGIDQRLDNRAADGPPTSGVAGAADSGKALLSVGGIVGGLAAVSCCIVPLTLFALGAGGAWIGNLTALAPYQPAILAVTVGFLGGGFYLTYRRPKPAACDAGTFCASPRSDRLVKTALWSASVLVVSAVAFNFVASILLDV